MSLYFYDLDKISTNCGNDNNTVYNGADKKSTV